MATPEEPRTDAGEPAASFGARLLAALRAEGLPFGAFDYAATQALKTADREQAIRILRAEVPLLGYRAIQMMRQQEPEELAQRMAWEARQAALLTFVAVIAAT